jgi:Subtilase family
MRRLLHWLALCVPLIVIPPTIHGQQNQTARQAIDLQEIVKFQQITQIKKLEKLDGANLAWLQFSKVPNQKQWSELSDKGFKVLSYDKDKTYLAAFPSHVSPEDLEALGVIAFAPTTREQKMATDIRNKEYPEHALTDDGQLKIAINFHPGYPKDRYYALLEQYDVEIMEDRYGAGNIFTLIVHPTAIDLIADEPLVAFIDVVTPPVDLLTNEVRSLHNATYVNSSNGFGLNGNGVVVGIGDGGELGSHLDFQDRVINYAAGTYSSFGDHGDHVAGIVGGGGMINPRHRGVASEATVLIQKTSLITYYAADYYNNHEMVLTNNSYGTSFNCTSNGTYNYTSQSLDLQLRDIPDMLHVFAAGNSGTQTCTPYPDGFFTLLRFYQSAKNVLTVGNVTDTREIKNNSSRGPASDGRLKPEICGVGTSVTSTGRNFDYPTKTGTSMSAPAVTGTLALMYESYRNVYGINPSGALIKAMACNTAEDLGNSGPDYTYGYGLINVRRAVEGIQDGLFFENAISNGGSATHSITIPANTKQVKVMLYWTDKEAEPYPVKALVNDLDLVLTTSGGTNYLPWVLNHNPSNVNDAATRQADHLNNIEQVTIDNPAAGTYTISVLGTEVPFGPQDYVVVYEFVTEDVVLTFPMGGEHLGFSEVGAIQWDTDISNTSTFKVEYSLDGGSNWNLIDGNIPASQRTLFWTLPSTTSENAFIRVTKNVGGANDSNATAFGIFGIPQLIASPACEGMVALEWNAIDGVDYYEIQKFEGTTIITIDTTTAIEFLVDAGNMILGEKYWFAVKGKLNNGMGTCRSQAQSCITTNEAACNWSNDVIAEAIIVSTKGRVGTSSALEVNEVISLSVKNIGDNAVSDIDLSYQVNGGTIVTESYTQSIASGQTIVYAFDQKANLSAVGTYSIDAWVTFDNDIDTSNNSIIGEHVSEQLDNDPVNLTSSPLTVKFELSN